jgi:lipopolysaccharide transport system ATP-binding protein
MSSERDVPAATALAPAVAPSGEDGVGSNGSGTRARPSADLAIRVSGLGKSYRLAHTSRERTTMADALVQRMRHPFRKTGNVETFWAVKDVSFDIDHGEVVGFIGRNGAGKSTLLKILSRITAPTTGRAEIFGRVGSLLEVGTGFHRELTGRENIYLNGAVLGMRRSEIERQFDAIVDFAGVEKFLDTPVKHYSSGMYVRLAFAVAAHLNPEILIVDEVLAVGDAEFQKKCLGKMKDVAAGGRTILFVSHNMRTVASLCTRTVFMRDGGVVADGKPEDVIPLMTAVDGVGAAPARVEFPPDPAKDAQVLSVTVRNARGEPSLRHDLMEPITFEIEVEVRRDLPSMLVSTQLRSSADEIVFVSTEADVQNAASASPSRIFPKKAGRYTARMKMPAPLLNLGQYELAVNLVIPGGSEVVDTRRGIRIEITDIVSFASCLNQRPRLGYVAVPVPWEVTCS